MSRESFQQLVLAQERLARIRAEMREEQRERLRQRIRNIRGANRHLPVREIASHVGVSTDYVREVLDEDQPDFVWPGQSYGFVGNRASRRARNPYADILAR